MKTIEQIAEKLMEINRNYDPWTFEDCDEEKEKLVILGDLNSGEIQPYKSFLEEILEDGVNDDVMGIAGEVLADLEEIKINKEEKTMKNTQIEEQIDAIIEVMDQYFTMPDYAVLNVDYLDSENPITKIHGTIMPNDLDELQDTYQLSVQEMLNGIYSGKYDADDDCCWYDKENGTINSCNECTIWNWIDQRSFAGFVLSVADEIERYALYEEAEARIKAIAAENLVEENLVFTDRELKVLYTGLEKLIEAASDIIGLSDDLSIESKRELYRYRTELVHLSHKMDKFM